MLQKSFSIYVHFPFCKHRCPYCDFNVHVRGQLPEKEFLRSILQEACRYNDKQEWKDRSLSTIFLGGGTPSLFNPELICDLIHGLKKLWAFDSDIEISLEANPEDITREYLTQIQAAGINRISIGAQSLSDKFLKLLGRNHNSKMAKDAIALCHETGIKNINIDLMHSLPSQTFEDLESDLNQAISLGTQHLSYYCLTIEMGTPFYEKQISGKIKLPDNDQSADFMERIEKKLISSGFQHYETSNFSKPDFNCRHNQNYWLLNDYLGLGPGAHSALSQFNQDKRQKIKRWANQSMPENYLKSDQNIIAWSEELETSSLAFETLMLGLRQTRGIFLNSIDHLINDHEKNRILRLCKDLSDEDFIHFNDTTSLTRLTQKGKLVADSINGKFAELLSQL